MYANFNVGHFQAAKINNNYILQHTLNCHLLALYLYNFVYGWAYHQGSLYRKSRGPYKQHKKNHLGLHKLTNKKLKNLE